MTATLPVLTGSYTLDPGHSRVGFVARHAMVTKVRGAFNDVTGSATVPEDVTGARVEVRIQAASIDTRNADRDAHLRSNDFLAMAEYPEITFFSTAVTQTDEQTVTVTGDLTIKGTTRSVEVPFELTGNATDPFGNERVGLEGSVAINRSDFGVSFNAPLETGGVLVSDKITLEFEISAIRSA